MILLVPIDLKLKQLKLKCKEKEYKMFWLDDKKFKNLYLRVKKNK